MKQERDKFLNESMGRCWHEWIQKYPAGGSECIHCGKYWPLFPSELVQRSIQHDTTPDFSTWEGFGKLWDWAQKQDWWRSFLVDIGSMHPCYGLKLNSIHADFISPSYFADSVYTFMKERDI